MKTKKRGLKSAFQVLEETKALSNFHQSTSSSPDNATTKGKKKKVENEDILEKDDSFDGEFTVDKLEEEKECSDNKPEPPHSVVMKSEVLARITEDVPCGNIFSEQCFQYLIDPMEPETFFRDAWEKRPVHICRNGKASYYKLFSCSDFDKIMRENLLEYSKNIDVVRYTEGERETLPLEGRVYASAVWQYFQDGCSIRMLNPQAYSDKLWRLCAHLQEYFGSFVGVNMYLTPPCSQGFAPHYDDIEAFVLQLEGRKHWMIYSPRSTDETLPRFSSPNFRQDEIGVPIMEIDVEAGDLLYFPRGFIHQARTVDDVHSLHITVSTYQKNTYGDVLKILLPQALERALNEDIDFRQSLPKDYMNYLGVAHEEADCGERTAFIHTMKHLTQKLGRYLSIDEAVDQHAKDYIHASLPPKLTPFEKNFTIHNGGEFWEDGRVVGGITFTPDTNIRLLRKRSIRLVVEDQCIRLYHNFENSRNYKELESKYVELDAEAMKAIVFLLQSHPEYVRVSDLPLNDIEEKMTFANDMYHNGLIMIEEPYESKNGF